MRIDLDPSSGLPLYVQVMNALREAVASGLLEPDTEVPSSRELAAQARVNYHTVARAYRELEGEGLLVRQRGGAYRVARGGGDRAAAAVLDDAVGELCRRARALGLDRQAVIAAVAEHWQQSEDSRETA